MTSKIDGLSLIAGIDIPLLDLRVNIHQPTIREIAYIGERNFYEAANIFTMDKEKILLITENLSEEDKVAISKMSNFEIFLKLVRERREVEINVLMLFTLLFPNLSIQIEERFIFMVDNSGSKPKTTILNSENFDVLQSAIVTILCLHPGTAKDEFNPVGDRARAIAEKIKKGREKVARLKGEDSKPSSFLSKYISGLGIGTNALNIHNVLDLTLYQLLNQIERYGLYTSYDISIRAKMAGAEDVEDVDWLKDIEK